MSVRKGGARRIPDEEKRQKIGPTVAPETVETLRSIAESTGESQGEVLDRLVAREAKRLRLKP